LQKITGQLSFHQAERAVIRQKAGGDIKVHIGRAPIEGGGGALTCSVGQQGPSN